MSINFSVRVYTQIRDSILSSLRSRYLALGNDISIAQDTDPYNWADAIAPQLEGLEARAYQLTQEIFPDTASEPYLLKHGDLIGLSLKPATPAKIFAVITGTPGSSWTASNLLVYANGLQYKPVADTTYPTGGGTLGGSGTTTITLQSVSSGANTNRSAGDILTWVSTPTGLNATATVTATPLTGTDFAVVGTDQESLTDFAQRILRWWLERPGSGNRADVVDWAESRSGIAAAFVYPLYHSSLGPQTLGAFTVTAIGPVSSRSTSLPLGLASGNISDIESFIDGTGLYLLDGGKVPVNVDPDDTFVVMPNLSYQNVDLQIVLGTGYSFPFTGTFSKASGSPASTVTRVYLTAAPTTIDVGDLVAVDSSNTGNTHGFIRGAYEVRTVSAKNDISSPYYIDVDVALGGIPADGNLVRPASANWTAMRDAVISVFDALGPADVDTGLYPKSRRWPRTDQKNPGILYKSTLAAVVQGIPGIVAASAVQGVVSATVITPSSDISPSAKTIAVPDKIWFRV